MGGTFDIVSPTCKIVGGTGPPRPPRDFRPCMIINWLTYKVNIVKNVSYHCHIRPKLLKQLLSQLLVLHGGNNDTMRVSL